MTAIRGDPRRPSPRPLAAMAVAVVTTGLFPASASAQSSQPASEPPAIGARLSADLLRDLPAGANLFSLLETTQPELVTDGFNSGGLNAGGDARASAFLASWAQTLYRLGDATISSPIDGVPMLFPALALWQHADVTTGAMRPDANAPGLAVSLEPRHPSSAWRGTIEGSGSGGRLASSPGSHEIPPIARLHDWIHSSAVLSGPVRSPRVGLVAGGTWTRNTTSARGGMSRRRQQATSGFAHAVVTPVPSSALSTLVWVQRSRGPALLAPSTDRFIRTQRSAAHVQSTFTRHVLDALPWRLSGSVTERAIAAAEATPDALVVDRLVDGPIPLLLPESHRVERRWSAGARVLPRGGGGGRLREATELAMDIEHVSAQTRRPFAGWVGELVDGVPARAWVYRHAAQPSDRRATTIAAFARERLALTDRTALDTSLRFEWIVGEARGAAAAVRWRTLLPAVLLHRQIGTPWDLTLFTGYRRSAHRLLLSLLAHGDPAAPAGHIFRWDGTPGATGTLIARVGPGTGGDPTFTAIDRRLKRPHTDEFAIGLASQPRRALRLGVTGIARRQAPLMHLVNIGAGTEHYDTLTIPDPNVDLMGPEDDQLLPIYDRRPESFGEDRYLLTNPEVDAATLGAIIVSARIATDRLLVSIGATAAAALGPAGHRGFKAFENDHDIIGELFTNPNAATFARGRLFNDRAYTIKWTTTYRLPGKVRLGVIARYQDGQPFSRIVIVPDLAQGPEGVKAFANGGSRFSFTGTLDVRLQKAFAMGRTGLDTFLDVYNLPNMRKEVEEHVVTGERFRAVTAVQPPRAMHVGARIRF